MKARFAPLALIDALLLAFGAIAAACGGGGDGELTLEEYFQELGRLNASVEERVDAIYEAAFAEFDEADFESLALEEQVRVFKDLADAFPPVVDDFLDDAKDLDPPAEVEDLHNDLVRAGDALLEVFQDLAVQIDEVQSQAELDALTEGGPSEAATERFDQACFPLQEIADENDIEVDLMCGDED